MRYRIRFTLPDGRTGLWNHDYLTREAAQRAIDDRLTDTGLTYTVEEAPGISAAAVPDAPPSTGVMPRRVWEEQRIRALGEAIVRRMGHEEPKVASTFDLAHVRDWAAEIVELCERNGGWQAKYEAAAALDGEKAP